MTESSKGAAGGALIASIFAVGCALMAVGLGFSLLFAIGALVTAWSIAFIATALLAG